MKKILLIFAISLAIISASAQECFYYYGPQKVPISRDLSHAVIFTPKNDSPNIRDIPSISVIRKIYDNTYDLTVIEQTEKINFSAIQRIMPKRSS